MSRLRIAATVALVVLVSVGVWWRSAPDPTDGLGAEQPRDAAPEFATARGARVELRAREVHTEAPNTAEAEHTERPQPIAADAQLASVTRGKIAALERHAPRDVSRARPAEVIAVDRSGRPVKRSEETDGCSYTQVHPRMLERLIAAADFVGIVELDYDHRKHGYLLTADGQPESDDEFTALVTDSYGEVLLNRAERSPDLLYVRGVCSEAGLCQIRGCPQYVNAGYNLVLAQRYCGARTGDQVVMVTLAVYPVEGDLLYDQDGSVHDLSDVLADIEIDEMRRARCES